MWKTLALCIFFLTQLAFADETPDKAIHGELRAITEGLTQAINNQKFDQLAPYFHEKMRVTTVNQEFLDSHAAIEPYFKRWFGPGGLLKTLEMKLSADAETELYDDNRFGIVRGKGIERYGLSDGRKFDMQTRWTATVIKDSDGKWRILALHIGTDFTDNPLLSAIERSVLWSGLGGAVGGLLLGVGLMWLVLRRKKAVAG